MKVSNFMLGFFQSITKSTFRIKQLELAPMEKDILTRSTFFIKKSRLERNLVTNLAKKDVSHNETYKLL